MPPSPRPVLSGWVLYKRTSYLSGLTLADLLFPKGIGLRIGGLSRLQIWGVGPTCLSLWLDDFTREVPGTRHMIHRYNVGAHCSLGPYHLVGCLCTHIRVGVYMCVVGGRTWWID